jgi:hypothetical protein
VTTRTLVLTLLAALALAAPASAATLDNDGGTLTFTGADALNRVELTQPGAGQVRVRRVAPLDTDPIVAPDCTQNTMGEDYTCNGVTAVVANGAGGDDALDASGLTSIPITLNGGTGVDALQGGGGTDTVNGDAGDDDLDANGGVDTVSGGDGTDVLEGGAGNDTVRGDTGGDRIIGGTGDDTVEGGDGDDLVAGASGNDLLRGEGGNDLLAGDAGNDDVTGGSGFDTTVSPSETPPLSIVVSLDDAGNDRLSGDPAEVDNVHGDVEGVSTQLITPAPLPPSGDDTVTGHAGANDLATYAGNDTVDGGAGNDVLRSGDGDDTIRARDGFADFVACGAGTDTVEADTLDRLEECETANVVDAGNANEDRPPTVELTGPAPNALLRTTAPTTMTATAADDRGIAQVLFLDDDRIVCADNVAPYTCDYRPRGEDVGRNTLVAVAVDTSQQTASVTRTFRVDRFSARITGAVAPGRDRRAPFTFLSSGRLTLPAGVSPALGCADGIVSVQIKAGARTLSNRRARLRRDCSFRSGVTFNSRRRFGRARSLRFTIRFTGNEVLNRTTAVARNVRVR